MNLCMLQYNEFMCTALSLLIRKSNQKEKKKENQFITKLLDNQHFPFCVLQSQYEPSGSIKESKLMVPVAAIYRISCTSQANFG